MSETCVILAEGLRKSYGEGPARREILRQVDLALPRGEVILCMGPSGSGKSTLLAALSGLVRPDDGRVCVFGEDLWRVGESRRERFRLEHFGFVFQGFNLFPALTAREHLLLTLRHRGVRGALAARRADEALAEVDLLGCAHQRPATLSGGEKQRVAIARALVNRPRLIFADEPTSALDRQNGMRVVELLRHAALHHDATIFCVTHDPRLLPFADRVIELDDGAVQANRAEIPPSNEVRKK